MKTETSKPATLRYSIPELAFDCGNHAVKGAAVGISLPWLKRGLYAYVDPDSEFTPEQLQGTTFVVYQSGDRTDLIDQAWIVGDAVPDLSLSYSRTRTAGKEESLLQMLLGSIPISQPCDVQIEEIICSNPHPKFSVERYSQALLGSHFALINGHEVTLTIKSVQVKPEGYGALSYGIRVGMFPLGKVVATIDIGGGTLIVTAWSEQGIILDKGRVTLDKGTNELVHQIMTDPGMRKLLHGDAQGDRILMAIESGLDEQGRLLYEDNEELDFFRIFERHRKTWAATILEESLGVLKPWEKRLKKIGIIGGGSNLIQPLKPRKPEYIALSEASNQTNGTSTVGILPNAQFSHVLGLISTAPEQISGLLDEQQAALKSASRNGARKLPAVPTL